MQHKNQLLFPLQKQLLDSYHQQYSEETVALYHILANRDRSSKKGSPDR
jgi:hypothetical protein